MTNELKEKLKEMLRTIFQFESEDLDFGIYRIMNYKRREIERFIDESLIREVEEQLNLVTENEIQNIKNDFEEIIEKIHNDLGENALVNGELEESFRNIPLGKKYYELKKQLEAIKITGELEKEIYNHIIRFFLRYYENGDFVSKRRYGRHEKYVVPYNGEEVLLYWANKDQYYIKTAEYFRRYSFDVNELKVNFRIVEAEEEKGNVKSQERKFFVLNERIFDFEKDKRELNIYFEYRALTDEEKGNYGNQKVQDKINEEIIKILKEKIPKDSSTRTIFEKEGEKSHIQKHLYHYTKRNTTDYFIHKDLRGFLEHELDFYIKNEFLQLENLQVLEQSDYFDKLHLYMIALKAFRKIALKIIEFLTQIENFQKKLWKKKKFVIETQYVITLDKIKEYAGEEFLESILDEIMNNEQQLNEWKDLFKTEISKKTDLIETIIIDGKEWKKLPIDTRYFDEDFKWRLLAALSKKNDLDVILDGVLIKSENWQALNLLLNKYYESVQAIYIDPPYNTGSDEFLYKDNYPHSSWLTMMDNRLRLAKHMLNNDGLFYCSIDWNETHRLKILLDSIFGDENFQREIIWNTGENISGFKSLAPNWIRQHDTIYFYTKSKENRILNKLWTPIDLNEFGWTAKTKLDILGLNKDNLYIEIWKNGKLIQKSISNKHVKAIGDVWNDIYSFQYSFAAGNEGLGFLTQKPQDLLRRIIQSSTNQRDWVLDFFGGSGTTAISAQKLNRRYICIEIAEHFDNVLLPRMKTELVENKIGISEKINWKGSGFFKYHTLEQYEDALENIEFEEPQKILQEFTDYFVKYMLEWETKNSKTFLNIDELKDPFDYKLKIIERNVQKVVNVDLIETFNYLLGLHVKGYYIKNIGRKYVFVFGEKDGKRIAIVWRSIKDIDFEKDKKAIEDTLMEFNPDEIYINGDASVKGFRAIEPLFKSLMFEKGSFDV